MLRLLTTIFAIAALAAVIADELYQTREAWGVTLALLAVGGGLIAIGFAIRHAPRPRARRRARGALPCDPGFPRTPLGAPYRGPH